MKTCARCRLEKSTDCFGKRFSSKDGLHVYCKICKKEESRKYYLENKETVTQRNKKWKTENPQRARDLQKKNRNSRYTHYAEYNRQWRKNNPEKVRLQSQNWYQNNLDIVRKRAREHARRIRQKHKTNPSVYFISDGDYVKIGYSIQLGYRMKSAARWNPRKLELLGRMDNTRQTEHDVHKRFEHIHVAGEWFQFTNELKEFIKANT